MSLPSGYTRLEYIESDSSSYLDTGVTMEKTDSVTLEEVLSPFGTSDIRYTGANGYMQIAITSSGYSINGAAKKTLGTKDKLKCIYTPTTESLYINGDLVESSNWSGYNGANVKIGLFKMGDHGNTWLSVEAHSGKCYGASIIKNGVKVREFIPCKNASGVAGMWDDVSKSFFSSASSFAFIAGSVYIGTHKTLVNGTVYEVKGGKCLVNGTVYNIKKGRTLIGGTGYDITFGPPPMPVKGDLITMNLDGTERQYRVLSVNGNVAKVMAMYDTLTSVYNSTNTTTTMGSLAVQKYEGSTLDTYLNTTWYNTLTSATKAAIVPENVVCDAWYFNNSGDPDYTGTYGTSVPGTWNYTISKYAGGTLNIGNRNIFALGVQDVIDYLNDSSVQVDTTAILRNVNIWKMFWNDEVSHSGKYLWLRSSDAGYSSYAWFARGDYGCLVGNDVLNSFIVRPALNLNLNQVKFTVV